LIALCLPRRSVAYLKEAMILAMIVLVGSLTITTSYGVRTFALIPPNKMA
jgi:hypothetical protein